MQGLYTGSVIGRGDPLSLRSQKALQQNTQQHREQREQQAQAWGTLTTVSLLRQRQAAQVQQAADAQESRFQGYVQRSRERRQAQPVVATEPLPRTPLDLTPLRQRQASLLAPIPQLITRDPEQARAAASTDLTRQHRASRPTTAQTNDAQPVDGPGFLAALQAHAEAEQQTRRSVWERTGSERVSAAPPADPIPAQEPIAAYTVAEHVTRHATAPGTVITPDVYTRVVTPAPQPDRVAQAMADLRAQYQARRTTTDTPPRTAAKPRATRPRRRGPITTHAKKERR
jgi:hypothetical protein